MKKTLKLLLIFMGSFIVILVGGIGGYNLIMNNQTFYIYDLRFVKPVYGARGYIYTKENPSYETISNSKVYLQSESENYIEIAVYAFTSNGTSSVNISSSDETVAKIEYRNNKCYVKYLKAGEAKITTSIGSVSDSFSVEIFDRIPSEFRVYDLSYYGENYAKRENYINKIVCYADNNHTLEYNYKYELFDATGNIDEEYFNNALLEVDENSNLDYYFDEISLDTENKQLYLKCKQQDLSQSLHTSIAINSYLMVDGKKCLRDIFEVDVYIIANEIEYVQIEVSTNPDFTNNSVFLNIDNVKYSTELTDEELLSYLTCQRIENNLEINAENAVYNVFITEKTPELYLKFRLVYTNGTVLELNKHNMGELYNVYVDGDEDKNKMDSNNSYLYLSDDMQNYLECEPMGEYFVLKLTPDYMKELEDYSSTLKFEFLGEIQDLELNANDKYKTFKFVYLDLDKEADIKQLYILNENGTYTYSYWDKRTIPDNVVYDTNRDVIEFIESIEE